MCFIVLGALLLLRIEDPKPIEQVRLISFDYYQNMLPKTISNEVVLLDIGEKSLEIGGQWPWPRSQIAQLVSDLRSSNAGIIGLTVMFPESDRFGQDDILKSWLEGNGVEITPMYTNTDLSLTDQEIVDNWSKFGMNILTLKNY